MHSLPGWQASLQVDNVNCSLGYRFLDISREREKNPLNQEKQKYSHSEANLQPVLACNSRETYEQRESKYKIERSMLILTYCRVIK